MTLLKGSAIVQGWDRRVPCSVVGRLGMHPLSQSQASCQLPQHWRATMRPVQATFRKPWIVARIGVATAAFPGELTGESSSGSRHK